MKSPNPIIWPVLFLHITHSANAKSHFTSHSTEIHALHHNKAPHPNKRDFLTCEETYGEGSIPCGGSDSKYCYDPTIGESCCMQDSGYCGLGDVCASIEGYCCHKDENEQICMLRLGISFPDDITSDPDFNSDIDSEDLDSSLTSISSSSSSSSSTSQSQSESESQSITHIKSDDESTDSDLGTESSDSDGASSPPMSMLMNALNSGPLADEDADADTDEDEDENADPDSALDSGSEGEGDVDTGTNVNPEPTTVVLSLGTAVASAVPFDVMNKGGVSSLGAGESSTLVSSLEGLETSSATAGSNANALTSSALPSQSISEGGLNASATTSAVDGTFTGGAVRIRRESGLEGGVARSCLFLGVSFVVWVVL